MNVWRIGSNWGDKNLLEEFQKYKIAFAGEEVENAINQVKLDDLVAITKGQQIIGLGRVQQLKKLKEIDSYLAEKYDDVIAIKLAPLYFANKNENFGIYGGQGKQFHQAQNEYIKLIKTEFSRIEKNETMQKYIDTLKANKNLILTGAPGTGKSYLAKEIAKNFVSEKIKNATDLFENFKTIIPEKVENNNQSWEEWKRQILSDQFCLENYANKIASSDYFMYFLERNSNGYGSSKPRNAHDFGIKLNEDNETYTISILNDQKNVNKEEALQYFEKEVKPFLQKLLKSSLQEKVKIVDSTEKPIKAKQLLRKIVVLEHPSEVLGIYQDETIDDACKYYGIGTENKGFLQKNIELYHYFLEKYKLEKSVETQFRVYHFIWRYFNKKNKRDIESDAKEIESQEQKMIKEYVDDHRSFVQFHPSYDYTDFVEGLRPIKKGETLGFELKNGTFKDFCKKAKNDPNNNYVFIIDEINRAEISKVFGELFFAIDPGYRGEKGKVKTQYNNIQTDETCFIDKDDDYFYIPENVYIIGTMNDIDRSVESFDFAMRRRFAWIEVKAEDRKSMWDGEIDPWKDEADKKMAAINQVIDNTEGLGSAYHIGPAYFLKLKDYGGDFQKLWDYHIGIILSEYLRGMPDAASMLDKLANAYQNPQ